MKGLRAANYRFFRTLLGVLAGTVILLSAIVPAHAYDLEFDPNVCSDGICYTNPLQTYTELGDNDPVQIVLLIVNTSLVFLGVVTLILFIVAGFMWLTAAGVEEKITKAKDIMKGAVIGLVIIMGSYGLAQYIFTAIRVATNG